MLKLKTFTKLFQYQQVNKHFCVQIQALQQAQTYVQQPGAYTLNLRKQENMPTITRRDDEVLAQNWWNLRSFEEDKDIIVPIFSFQNGTYSGESVELPQDVFNVPLRRDIIQRVLLWRQNLYSIKTHMTRNKATTAGSGKKPTPQKGQGNARRGNKRAPGLKKGGKVHGAKPRMLRYSLNKKVRLQALYCMLSAKLAEGKLRVIDTEKVDLPKTQIVAKILSQTDRKSRILLIHGYNPCDNFLKAQQNIQRLEVCAPNKINIIKLLKQERVFITKDGLQQLVQDLRDRKFLQYRQKITQRVDTQSEIQRKLAQNPNYLQEEEQKLKDSKLIYDPSKPISFKFQILNDYVQEYEKVRKEGRLEDYKI